MHQRFLYFKPRVSYSIDKNNINWKCTKAPCKSWKRWPKDSYVPQAKAKRVMLCRLSLLGNGSFIDNFSYVFYYWNGGWLVGDNGALLSLEATYFFDSRLHDVRFRRSYLPFAALLTSKYTIPSKRRANLSPSKESFRANNLTVFRKIANQILYCCGNRLLDYRKLITYCTLG